MFDVYMYVASNGTRFLRLIRWYTGGGDLFQHYHLSEEIQLRTEDQQPKLKVVQRVQCGVMPDGVEWM
jgi:hypothetical protein